MNIYIKNTDTVQHKWAGQYVQPDEYYEIEDVELNTWQNSSQLLADIGTSIAIVAKDDDGEEDIIDVSEAINYLLGNVTTEVTVTGNTAQGQPFATSVGHTFKGKGFKGNCINGEATMVSYQIDSYQYDMTGIEILNGALGDEVHMKILDDASGTYSTIPNYQLDEFGITWNVRPAIFVKDLPYSARVMPGMVIAFDYTNNSGADRMIYINLDLHRIV